jgi:threonine synthase
MKFQLILFPMNRPKPPCNRFYEKYNYIADPHTAVGIHVAEEKANNETTVVMSTAHPAKFKADVEQILGIQLNKSQPLPKQLSDILNKPQQLLNMCKTRKYCSLKLYLIRIRHNLFPF